MHVNPGHLPAVTHSHAVTPAGVKAKKVAGVRPEAKPYLEGKGYAMRKQYRGNDIYVSGFLTAGGARKAVGRKLAAIDKNMKPAGLGADKTTLAQALQDYALARLPFMKGAVQEAVRINHYLRYAGLETLVVTRCAQEVGPLAQEEKKKGKTGKGAFFVVALQPHSLERKIANGLGAHRKAQLTANAGTEKHRAVLASTTMSKITRDSVQKFMDVMRHDGNAASTMALERSMLRVLFYHAVRTWNWSELLDNPATGLKMPTVDNVRKRVMSADEQQLLDAALGACRSKLVAPMLTLLRETAMRSSEPLQQARWKDVNWARKVLTLRDSKTGEREVPLSPLALQALQAFEPGEPEARIVEITYESLKKSWTLACKRVGIKNLQMHDLRRTAATRMALKTGNVFLVKALTGHKTMAMMERYINVGADDVVNVMHQPESAPAELPAPAVTLAHTPLPEAPAQTAPATASVAFTLEQVQSLVQQTVQSTLEGLRQCQPVASAPAPVLLSGATLSLVQPATAGGVSPGDGAVPDGGPGLSLVAPPRRMV